MTNTRNATLPDLMDILQRDHARKLDIVAPASAIRSVDAAIRVTGTDPILTDEGVTSADGIYVPTTVADEGIASKLDVPIGYLRRMREGRPDLYDANVNGWLHGRKPLTRHVADGEPVITREGVPGDSRSFLLRAFRGDDTEQGILRAFLSDRYSIVDNIDVLMAALDGIRAAGVQVDIAGGDLTDRRMVVRVHAPEVAALAPRLLAGYRSPFTGQSGSDNPTVFAGFVLSNSETGGGAFRIVPQVIVQVCTNGMTITKDAMKEVHLGGKLDAGVVRWADDTQRKSLELVQAKTRDAVATFLSADYLTNAVTRLEAKADQPVDTVDRVRDITKPLGYTQGQIDGIMSYFVQGGQMTLGGVVNAITAYSQTVEDGDDAYVLDARATTLLGV